MIKHRKAFLDKHDGIRPQRWDTFHSSISKKTLRPYLNKWGIIEKCMR